MNGMAMGQNINYGEDTTGGGEDYQVDGMEGSTFGAPQPTDPSDFPTAAALQINTNSTLTQLNPTPLNKHAAKNADLNDVVPQSGSFGQGRMAEQHSVAAKTKPKIASKKLTNGFTLYPSNKEQLKYVS